VAILLLSSMQQVFAAGTLAGTVITNKAFVTYNAGSNVRNDSSAAVTMTVGYKVSINQDVVSNSSTSLDSTTVFKTFTVTNSGNHGDAYKFTIVNLPTNWVDTLYQGTTVISNGGTFYFGVDTSWVITVKITIPGNLSNGYLDSVRLSIESNPTPPVGVVRVGGVGLVYHTEKITIAKPVITISGSQSATPANAIPGAAYQYTISLQNTGSVAISGSATLTFKLDNDFRFSTASNSGTNSGTDVNGNGGTVSWTFTGADLPASMGTPITRTVNVVIEQVTANGTGATVGNLITIMDSLATPKTTTQIDYSDGVHSYIKGTPALAPITVAKASGATLVLSTTALASRTGNPGDSVRRIIVMKNTGNGNATTNRNIFSFTRVLTGSTNAQVADSFSYRYDTSATELGTYTRRTDTTGHTFSFSLAGGESYYIVVEDTIYGGVSNGQFVTNSYTVARTDGGVAPTGGSITVTLAGNTTTATTPTLSIIMTTAFVSGVGTAANPAPGDIIEYILTITNSGAGIAKSVTTSNPIPTNTTFVTNAYGAGTGIMVDTVPKTNAVDVESGGNASFSASTVSTGPTDIASGGGTKTIKYQVTVN
ncbi:MAG: hypothetical protein PHP42_13745, partial [Bacteroidota bacterium]|nr:hypothetical protein [Bacteroidota bacterium]